jgi:hypothetical protein
MIIELKKLEHVKSKSVYNHNFYKGREDNTDTMLLVDSRDDTNNVTCYIVDDTSSVFLGCGQNCDEVLHIDLGIFYT